MIPAWVFNGGKITDTLDEVLNDSDKTVTVPTGKRWIIEAIRARLITTGDVGNRILMLQIRNSTPSELFLDEHAITQAATLTRTWYWFVGATKDAAFSAGGYIFRPIPEITLEEGDSIRIWDTAAIAATADDLTITIRARELDI